MFLQKYFSFISCFHNCIGRSYHVSTTVVFLHNRTGLWHHVSTTVLVVHDMSAQLYWSFIPCLTINKILGSYHASTIENFFNVLSNYVCTTVLVVRTMFHQQHWSYIPYFHTFKCLCINYHISPALRKITGLTWTVSSFVIRSWGWIALKVPLESKQRTLDDNLSISRWRQRLCINAAKASSIHRLLRNW